MEFSSFRLNVTLRVTLLTAVCIVLAWSLRSTQWVATPIVCGALVLLTVIELVRYVERTARDLTQFLRFVAHHDSSTPYVSAGRGRIFGELQEAYRLLAGEFRRLNQQKAADHQYLAAVIEHVSVALFCFDEEGIVRMMNDAARRMFGLPHVNSLSTLQRVDERLPEMLRRMGDGERTLIDVRHGEETLQLVLYTTTFVLLERRYKLVSIQNIRDELDRQEIESWQKLIRVLTHEIMNSVTPIISLSRLLRETMIDDSTVPPTFRDLTSQERDDMLRGVSAIHSRSSGLLDFVQSYRSFAKLPMPQFAEVDVAELFERVRTLMSHEIEGERIELTVDCREPGLRIRADAQQAEQVLINVLRNAVEALAGSTTPRISLRGLRNEHGDVLLQVADNGPGIAPEHLDSVFVPFFTTKRNGSGVGLSICRQIMRANRGLISARSAPGEGSVFTLKFE